MSLLSLQQVIVTVFAALSDATATVLRGEDTDEPMLNFNVYSPKLNESADVVLPHSMQKMMVGA